MTTSNDDTSSVNLNLVQDMFKPLTERFSKQTLDLYYMDWDDCPEHVKPLKEVVEREVNRYKAETATYNEFDDLIMPEVTDRSRC